MLAHLHQPDIDRLVSGRLSAPEAPLTHRHLTECELCLRRLIDAELAGLPAGDSLFLPARG